MRAFSILAVLCITITLAAGQTKKPEQSEARSKIERAKLLLQEVKKELAARGEYNCCIKAPGCDRCALDHQNCDCANDVKKGKPVCPDCFAGWKRGDGTVPGVSPSKVKLSSHGHTH